MDNLDWLSSFNRDIREMRARLFYRHVRNRGMIIPYKIVRKIVWLRSFEASWNLLIPIYKRVQKIIAYRRYMSRTLKGIIRR